MRLKIVLEGNVTDDRFFGKTSEVIKEIMQKDLIEDDQENHDTIVHSVEIIDANY